MVRDSFKKPIFDIIKMFENDTIPLSRTESCKQGFWSFHGLNEITTKKNHFVDFVKYYFVNRDNMSVGREWLAQLVRSLLSVRPQGPQFDPRLLQDLNICAPLFTA